MSRRPNCNPQFSEWDTQLSTSSAVVHFPGAFCFIELAAVVVVVVVVKFEAHVRTFHTVRRNFRLFTSILLSLLQESEGTLCFLKWSGASGVWNKSLVELEGFNCFLYEEMQPNSFYIRFSLTHFQLKKLPNLFLSPFTLLRVNLPKHKSSARITQNRRIDNTAVILLPKPLQPLRKALPVARSTLFSQCWSLSVRVCAVCRRIASSEARDKK